MTADHVGAAGFLDEQRANRRRTVLLLGATFALLLVVANAVALVLGGYQATAGACTTTGGAYGGRSSCPTRFVFQPTVLVLTVVISAGYVIISYLLSARAALAITGAHKADGPEYAQLRNLVEGIAIAAGMVPPAVYVIDDPAPNAFATGRNPAHSAMVATTGLLGLMSRRELEGVVAHELSHIRNRDTSVMTLAVLSVGGIVVVSDVLMRLSFITAMSGGNRRQGGRDNGGNLLVLIGPLLYLIAVPSALLLKAALSRSRESLADATAVDLTRNPSGLRSALEKLESDSTVVRQRSNATAHLWIESPLDRRDGGTKLFDTHPPLSERIARLRSYEGLDPEGRGPNDASPVPRAPAVAAPDAGHGHPDHDDDRGDHPGQGGPFGGGPGGLPGPFGGMAGGGGPFGGMGGPMGLGGGRPGRGGRRRGGFGLGFGVPGAPPPFNGPWSNEPLAGEQTSPPAPTSTPPPTSEPGDVPPPPPVPPGGPDAGR